MILFATKLRGWTITSIRHAKAIGSPKTDGVKLGVWQRGGGDEAGLQRERERETAPTCLYNFAAKCSLFIALFE